MGKILISQKLVGINLKIGPLMAIGHKPVRYVGPGELRDFYFVLSKCKKKIMPEYISSGVPVLFNIYSPSSNSSTTKLSLEGIL